MRALNVWPLALVALLAWWLVPLTPLRALGPLTVALLAGMALAKPLRAIPRDLLVYVSREVLRAGVVLTAVRLDWVLLARAGAGPIVVAVSAVVIGLVTFAGLLRLLGVPPRLGALLAVGTSVCGAAAITAARPVVDASDEDAHSGIAIISVLGALASLLLVVARGLGWIPSALYGLVAGGSLHEVAHVMAAGTADPSAVDIATVTKLARVALLPVALIVLPLVAPRVGKAERTKFKIPPLVVWFVAVSIIATIAGHSTDAWKPVARHLGTLATWMLAASMVAIGALVDWKTMRKAGRATLVAGVAGSLILAAGVAGVAAEFG